MVLSPSSFQINIVEKEERLYEKSACGSTTFNFKMEEKQ